MKKTILILALIPILFLSACSENTRRESACDEGQEITSIKVRDNGGIASPSTVYEDKKYVDAIMDEMETMDVSDSSLSYGEALENSETWNGCGSATMDIWLLSGEETVEELTYVCGYPPYIGNDTYGYHEIYNEGCLSMLLKAWNDGAKDALKEYKKIKRQQF